MVKEILQSIEGVEIYPVIGLILFIFSFLMALLSVWRMGPREIEQASRLPLIDNLVGERSDNCDTEQGDE